MTSRSSRPCRPGRAWALLFTFLLAACAGDTPQRDAGPDSEPPGQAEVTPDSTPMDVPTRRFEGAWFAVSYPENFSVRPSLESGSAEGFDSAFFDSPLGEVTFYVHVPQWGGEPTDIALDPATEQILESSSSTEGSITTTRITLGALDGTWERSYVTESDDRGPTQWTIGWRYASAEARERYAPVFEAFRASLTKLAS